MSRVPFPSRSVALVLAALACFEIVPVPALAADPAPAAADASVAADALVKKAIEALKRDAPAEAEKYAREAWALKQSYDIASNLGLAELGLKRYRAAAEHLAYALRYFPSNGKPEHKKLLELSFAKARAEVAEITVRSNVDGAELWMNGLRVGLSPLKETLFADAGACTIEAKREGYAAATQTVTTQKGGAVEVSLALEREPPPMPTASATATAPPPPPPRSKVPAFVIGGVGAASLILGGVLVGVANGSQADIKAKSEAIAAGGAGCPADPRCADLESTARNGDSMSRAGVGLLIGGVALGAAAGAYLLWPSGQTKQGALRVVPIASQQGGGLVASGNF